MPVVPDGLRLTGEPGSRAPHMWLSRAGTRVSTLDLYERSLVLLSSEDGACDRHTAATHVAQQLSVPLDSYRIGAGPAADLTPVSETDWAEVHGATPDGAVLVRPDGFVAWRSEGASADPEWCCGKPSRRSWAGTDRFLAARTAGPEAFATNRTRQHRRRS